jgi:transposase
MRREYGWAASGLRAFGTKPGRTWQTLTLIGAVRLGERPKLMTHRGPVNGKVFLHFVKRRLRPWLRRGDVVVMDNLGAHKTEAVRKAIEACGAIPIYLPPYSPELNPIELWWAHLKRELRTLRVDLRAELGRVVRRLRSALPVANIAAWFRHALAHGLPN